MLGYVRSGLANTALMLPLHVSLAPPLDVFPLHLSLEDGLSRGKRTPYGEISVSMVVSYFVSLSVIIFPRIFMRSETQARIAILFLPKVLAFA